MKNVIITLAIAAGTLLGFTATSEAGHSKHNSRGNYCKPSYSGSYYYRPSPTRNSYYSSYQRSYQYFPRYSSANTHCHSNTYRPTYSYGYSGSRSRCR